MHSIIFLHFALCVNSASSMHWAPCNGNEVSHESSNLMTPFFVQLGCLQRAMFGGFHCLHGQHFRRVRLLDTCYPHMLRPLHMAKLETSLGINLYVSGVSSMQHVVVLRTRQFCAVLSTPKASHSDSFSSGGCVNEE